MSALPRKLQVKLYAESGTCPEGEAFVPVFHRWIRQNVLDALMIDVADYGHVPGGPGVLLVGHAFDLWVDRGEGRPGLFFSQKREAPPPEQRLVEALRRVLFAADRLTREPELSGLRFATSELLFRVNDRLAAPNADSTFAALRAELAAGLERALGPVTLTREGSHLELFSVRVRAAAPPLLPDALARLA